MTFDEIREYVIERGESADEHCLIKAIEEHTIDSEVRELIDFWFKTLDVSADDASDE